MTSFTGDEIYTHDTVCFIKNTMTSTSTTRKCKYIGEVVGFNRGSAVIKVTEVEPIPKSLQKYIGTDMTVKADDIICVINKMKQAADYQSILDYGGIRPSDDYDCFEGI